MALPGISFEIVRSAGPVLGLRTDRTALVAMTQRGRVEEPVLVHSEKQYIAEFGCSLPGTFGGLAATAYFKNGGEELIVCRFVGEAKRAHGSLAVVDSPSTVGFRARDPGSFGNSIRINTELTNVGIAGGTLVTAGLQIAADSGPADPLGLVVRLLDGIHAPDWANVTGVTNVNPTQRVLTLAPSASLPLGAVDVEFFQPTFTLRIREPLRADVVIPGLDLRDVPAANEKLAPYSVTIDAFTTYSGVYLPEPGVPVHLSGGSDGLDDAGPARQDSFRRCVQALEVSDLPDIVIAPDLWNAIWATKGVASVGFDPDTAIGLADEMVRSAGRVRDRVVLLDAPLTGYDAMQQSHARPLTVSELVAWRNDRVAALGDDRDFTAAYAPWTRVVSEPVYRGDDTLLAPPSAAVAGRMARTSRERGPWVATGNVSLETVIGLSETLSVGDQEALQDVGICPLRLSTPRGATIQGVRSLSWPERKPWRFLSTRRLFNFLRRALTPIARSYVFEPNAPETWIRLRRELQRLLTDLFNRGALAGSRPDQAFFVSCNAALNPEAARDNGVLTAVIGVAPAFPLEFLVVRLVAGQGVARVAEEPFVS